MSVETSVCSTVSDTTPSELSACLCNDGETKVTIGSEWESPGPGEDSAVVGDEIAASASSPFESSILSSCFLNSRQRTKAL